MSQTDSKDFLPNFRQKKLDEKGFLKKLARFAFRLGRPAVKQLYALYYLFQSPNTPKRAKLIIVGALIYFFSPFDSLPDLLGPLGFTDDLAVVALVYSQMREYLTDEIKARAAEAADKLSY